MKWAGTPEGSRDRLFEECKRRRRLETDLSSLMEGHGYSEVMTPALEYYDTMVQSGSPIPQQAMLKLTDRDGRIVVMRPDNTTPIARLAGSRLRHLPPPHRLYYRQEVFRSDTQHRGRSAENMQIGVELLGQGGIEADLEVIALAAEALRDCGANDFHLELGHAGLFPALADRLCHQAADAGREQPDVAALRDLTERKNYPLLQDYLREYAVCPAAAALNQLVRLFGGREVFEEAKSLCLPKPLGYLAQLYDMLDFNVSVDLGLVSPLDYYTGVMFYIYLPGMGTAAVSGGRYDNLLSQFGLDWEAVGFALDIDGLAGKEPTA